MKKKNENSTFQTWKIPAQARKVLGTKSWTLKRGTNWVGEGTCCTNKNLTKLLLGRKGPKCQGLTNVKHEAPKYKTHANFVGAGDSLQVQEVPYTTY